MKNAFLLLLLGAAACSSPHTDPVPAPTPYTVGWQVDGQEFRVDHWVVSFTRPASTLSVSGREYPNGGIVGEVQLEVPAAVGTHAFGASSAAWATYERNGRKYYAGAVPGATTGSTGSGTVVLTALTDHLATGAFTFTGLDPVTKAEKSLTHGTFQVPL